MYNIKPVWVLSLLDNVEHKEFETAFNEQFIAFTENELDLACNSETDKKWKWWGIDHISQHTNIDTLINEIKHLPQSLVDSIGVDRPLFDSGSLSIIIYGNSSTSTDNFNMLINKLNNINFGGINKLKYCIIHINKNEVDEQLFDIRAHVDALVLLGDSNFNVGYNNKGFKYLIEKDQKGQYDYSKRYFLAIQLIQNIALGYSVLTNETVSGKNIFLAGSFSLSFEPGYAIGELVKNELTSSIFREFFNNRRDSFWYDKTKIDQSFSNISKELSVSEIYTETVFNYQEEFKDIKAFFTHKISPWSLFSLKLITKYFNEELKTLPQDLVNYAHLLDLKYLNNYQLHLQKTIDAENGLKVKKINEIKRALLLLWSDADHTSPIGLQQFIDQLSKIKEYLEDQTLKLNKDEEYKKIYAKKEPLKIPHFLKNNYKKYADGGESNDLNERELENWIKTLINKIKTHAVPLSLFTRSAIVGVMLSIISFAIIKIIPNNIFNTSWFETDKGIYVWFAVTIVLPILLAIIKYWILTLLRIRHLKKNFLAWIFYKIQRKLLTETKNKLSELYNELLAFCINIEDNISKIMMVEKDENKKSFTNISISEISLDKILNKVPIENAKYPQNYFQQSVFGTIDNVEDDKWVESLDFGNFKINGRNVNSLNMEDKSQIFREFIHETIEINKTSKYYHELFDNYIIKYEDNFHEFISLFQNFISNKIISDSISWKNLTLSEKAIETIEARSYPTMFKKGLRDSEYKGEIIIANNENVPINIKKRIEAGQALQNCKVISIKKESTPVIKGILQIMKFIRLNNIENVNVKIKKKEL